MVVQRNLLEKAYFIAKMFGQAMIQQASSDFWKAPAHALTQWTLASSG